MKYRFVLRDKGTPLQGWWLKISTLEELLNYHERTESQMVTGFKRLVGIQKSAGAETAGVEMYIESYAANRGLSLVEASSEIDAGILGDQMGLLLKGYNVYINQRGGWFFGARDYSDWYDSENLVFPDFTEKQIRIEQWGGGKHYYAYVGKLQVKDGDTIKWNTYEEAYRQAMTVIGKDSDA